MRDLSRLDEQVVLAQRGDDRIARLLRRQPVEPELREKPAGLVHGNEHGQVVHARQLEILRAGAGRDVHDATPFVERDVVPRDHAVLYPLQRGSVVERPPVAPADELGPVLRLRRYPFALPLLRPPLALRREDVFRIGAHSRGHVRGQRPRRRRPDDERLALALRQRKANVQRRMNELHVLVVARLLVLRQRRAATRTPLRRTVSLVEPSALVDGLQEPPDVFDVRVAEGEIRVVPVHPLAEARRLLGPHARVVRDALFAARRELGDAVLLDVALRAESERLLDLHLNPEPLRVETVLIALVEATERLVALEEVLVGSAPDVVDAHRIVRRDRAVNEAPLRPAAVLRAQPVEDALRLPPLQELALERGMVGLVRERCEHTADSRGGISRGSAALKLG